MNDLTTPNTILDLLGNRVRTNPQAIAVRRRIGPGQWADMTWREMTDAVVRVATAFRALGLAPGERLAIRAANCPEWLIAELAGLQVGAAVVGLEPQCGPDWAAHVLTQADVRGLVVDRSDRLTDVPPAVLRRLRFIVTLDEGGSPDVHCWRGLPDGDALPGPGPAGSDEAMLIYTSGTSGTPKGIAYTHAQLLLACRAIVETFPFAASDTTLCWLPLAHLFQRMLNWVALACGITICFVDDPSQVLLCAREVEPSGLGAVPRFLEKLHAAVRAGQLGPHPLGRRLKFVITGAAPIASTILEDLQQAGVPILEAYGLSENIIPVAANRPGACRFGSVGLPLAANQIQLAADGEILVRGSGLFTGYLGESSAAECFTPDGFFRTGDLGRFDEDGYLYLLGRRTEIIKTSTGRRIAPARVEQVYRQCPHLDQVVVFGDGHPHLVALVTLQPGAHGTPALRARVTEAIAALGEQLAPYERVRHFAILPEPLSVSAGELTPTYKLCRERIAERHRRVLEHLYEAAARRGAVRELREAVRPV
jgi:long-chain acyl-CoA synthetase